MVLQTCTDSFYFEPSKKVNGSHGFDPRTSGENSWKSGDGTAPASIFVDWDSDAGAIVYQIEWYSDSEMAQSSWQRCC